MNKYKLTNGKRVRATNQVDALLKAGLTNIQYSTSYTGRVTPFAIDDKGNAIYATPQIKIDGSDKYMPLVILGLIIITYLIIILL
jgi:hypothetical protein